MYRMRLFLMITLILFSGVSAAFAPPPVLQTVSQTPQLEEVSLLTELSLEQSKDTLAWGPVSGSLSQGYLLTLDPVVPYFYLRVSSLTATVPLKDGLHPFFLTQVPDAASFYDYWDIKHVNASAPVGSWEAVMWQIINGNQPMFYLKVTGTSYTLVDGLQYLFGHVENPLRISGDYPTGPYTFTGELTDTNDQVSPLVAPMAFQPKPAITNLSLEQASLPAGPWSRVFGSLDLGFLLSLDPLVDFHYLRVSNVTINTALKDGYHPFYLNQVPDDTAFFAYWALRGVEAGATTGWQAVMWQIINGDLPMFYLKVTGTTYTLVDGLQYLTSQGDQPLRISGDYPLGAYRFSGTLTDTTNATGTQLVDMTFQPLPYVSDLTISYTDDETWSTDDPVYGSLANGFTLSLDPSKRFYYLKLDTIDTTGLKNGYHPFYLAQVPDPDAYFAYWATNGVNASAAVGTWQAVMWQIINGNEPMFYLKADNSTYTVVDGLQKLTGQGDHPLRISGDYPLGAYSFLGWLSNASNETTQLPVWISFQPLLSINTIDLFWSQDLTTWQQMFGTLSGGYHMTLDGSPDYYYLDASGLTVNTAILDYMHPFKLDPTSVPAGFYTYWEGKGVVSGATGWQGVMWQIINGDLPMFYLKVDQGEVDLIDGLMYNYAHQEQPLKLNGDYPLGAYTFLGEIFDQTDARGTATVMITFQPLPEITSLDMVSSTDQTTWSPVSGSLPAGYLLTLDPAIQYFYLDIDELVAKTTLKDDDHPFYLDTTALPSDFYAYWAAKGVFSGASSWQGVMWQIINGDLPMFYLKVDGSSYTLIDGLQKLTGQGDQHLRISGDYPLGDYLFTGELTDETGVSKALDVQMTFQPLPEITSIDMISSTDQTNWSPVSGTIGSGYQLSLDPVLQYYYLDIDELVAKTTLKDGDHPFYLDTTALPSDFYTYWAAKGVVSGASSWQGVMWQIINGDLPMFYLKVDGDSFTLIDGLLKLIGQGDQHLRISGDYPLGDYLFTGELTDTTGAMKGMDVEITFVATPKYAVDLQAATVAKSGLPGAAVSYTVTIKNNGNQQDTFVLTTSGSGWTTDLPANPTLAAGASKDLTIVVHIPGLAAANASNVVKVKATSLANPAAFDEISLTTTALTIHDVEISGSKFSGTEFPGGKLTFSFMISNTGNIAETVLISLSDKTWGALDKTQVTLDLDESELVTLTVTIPGTATDQQSKKITLSFTTEGSTIAPQAIDVTATAKWHHLCFPIVNK